MKNVRSETLLDFSFRKRLPIIHQTETAECGLACIAMVLTYHGYKTDLTELRQRFSVSSHGATLEQLISIANNVELATRALRLGVEQLSKLQVPCILHWEMKHFVVLKKVSATSIVIHDPGIGERILKIKDVELMFTGVALELIPSPEFKIKPKENSLSFSHFWSRIGGLKSSLITIFVLALFLQLFAIVNPYYLQVVIDDVVLKQDTNLLLVLAFGFSLLLIIDVATSFLREYVILNFSNKLNIQISSNVFYHLIRLPMEYFSKRHVGDIVSRFGSLETIRNMLTTGLITVLIDGLMAIITLVVMFIYDTRLTIIVLCVVFIYAIFRFVSYQPFRKLNEEQIIAAASENSHFIETTRAIQTLKLFELESTRQNQWQNKYANFVNKSISISKWNISFNTVNKILFGFENILIIYFAAIAVIDNLISIGMLYAFLSYKSKFIGAANGLINKWIEFKMLGLHFDRLSDIVFSKKDGNNNEHLNSNISLSKEQTTLGNIIVNDLEYRYGESESNVFHDVSFTVNEGETIAITGPSGCGKSTLIKCLMGLLTPSGGEVFIDGVQLTRIPNYRKKIAGVLQDDQLLSGTIKDNIACFDADQDMDRIMLCAKLACLHDEITNMAMQYNTLVGDMGSGLSGGQQQRLIIARAFYKKPKILFMDEATSNLDVANEINISRNIKELSITRILVAHRSETIRTADRVFEMNAGGLKEIQNIHRK